MKENAIQAIIGAARTGRIGDGKIFVSRIDEAIRIRNDERGETALLRLWFASCRVPVPAGLAFRIHRSGKAHGFRQAAGSPSIPCPDS